MNPTSPTTPPTPTAGSVVVVAIDDSAPSVLALAWAADYARQVHAELRAIHVLRYDFSAPVAWSPGLRGAPQLVSGPEIHSIEADLQELFDAVDPEPSWSLRFLDGPVGQTVVEHARDARLLVIGTKEHRGIDRLIVGSVSHYCLSHTTCPVVAVPPEALAVDTALSTHAAIPMPSGVTV